MFNRFAECQVEGCSRSVTTLVSGVCGYHQRNLKHKHTSDGRRVGGRLSKLSPEQAQEAKRMFSAFKTKREIAAHFGVSVPTISRYLAAAQGPRT